LLRPLGTTFPDAVATTSSEARQAQSTDATNSATTVRLMARPIGDGGVSTTSSAAGRNASSYSRRRSGSVGNRMIFLADVMDAGLEVRGLGVTAVGADQLVVGPVLDQTPALDGDDAIGPAHRGEPVGNDQDGAAFGDLPHVLLDDALAFVVEGTGRLV